MVTGRLAITVILPEAEARAMIAMAAAAGDLIDPATVAIDGFVMVSRRAFEGLLQGLREDVAGKAGAAGESRRSGPAAPGGEGHDLE